MTAPAFKRGFRAPPKPVGVKPVTPTPAPIAIVQTAANRAAVAADPDILLVGAEDVEFTVSHRFEPAVPPAMPPRMVSDLGARDAPTDRPRCIPPALWLELWPDDRRVEIVERVGLRVFGGQPPVNAFRAVLAEIDEASRNAPRILISEEEFAVRRGADLHRMRENILADLKRAVSRPLDEPCVDIDSAGEARILAYRLPEDGSPSYWERGDRYPRPEEVDMTPAPARPMPTPWTNRIKHRI